MDALHHRAEAFAAFEVAEGVVVVVEEGGDPGGEAVGLGVVVESVPEDLFGFFIGEGGGLVAAAGGDEVGLVVGVPVFEAVVAFEDVGFGGCGFSEVFVHCEFLGTGC
ncbi:hypothetical protein OT109_04470 [Phycisphaeraceae bacterium D3-23]